MAGAAMAVIGAAALLGSGLVAPLPAELGGLRGAKALAGSTDFADPPTDFTDTPSTPSLKDILAKGLEARRPEEFAFVDKVVRMVDRGRLPLEMVQTTFLWARKKEGKHQFQYFERGLKLRAQQCGVKL
jgi:hypothetical protein